jgi:hypothetical protein
MKLLAYVDMLLLQLSGTASGQIHDAKQKDVKNQHIRSDA